MTLPGRLRARGQAGIPLKSQEHTPSPHTGLWAGACRRMVLYEAAITAPMCARISPFRYSELKLKSPPPITTAPDTAIIIPITPNACNRSPRNIHRTLNIPNGIAIKVLLRIKRPGEPGLNKDSDKIILPTSFSGLLLYHYCLAWRSKRRKNTGKHSRQPI